MTDRARIVFLGTGGVNSIERSSAGIAVELPSGQALLLDTCGGNEILRQLHGARIATDRVRTIVVTHQHYDHAAGLPLMILQASRHAEPLDAEQVREIQRREIGRLCSVVAGKRDVQQHPER